MRLRVLIFSLLLLPSSMLAIAATPVKAVFAGGCFWCMQPPFDKTPGVIKTVAGYTGGHVENPTYKQTTTGKTGHYEAVEVFYDPSKVTYQQLLKIYWRNIDPTDGEGQFCDRGSSYRPAIFYYTKRERQLAEQSKQQLLAAKKFKQINVPILPAKTFYKAEAYHQNYYKKNPLRYKYYRYACGRDKRLQQLWAK